MFYFTGISIQKLLKILSQGQPVNRIVDGNNHMPLIWFCIVIHKTILVKLVPLS